MLPSRVIAFMFRMEEPLSRILTVIKALSFLAFLSTTQQFAYCYRSCLCFPHTIILVAWVMAECLAAPFQVQKIPVSVTPSCAFKKLVLIYAAWQLAFISHRFLKVLLTGYLLFALKTQANRSSETPVNLYHTNVLHCHGRENLEPHRFSFSETIFLPIRCHDAHSQCS